MQTLRPNPNASYRSVPEALYKMVRYEGVLRPIKGVSAVICSAGPAHALYFACYEKMKEVISGTTDAYKQTHLAHGLSFRNLHFSICVLTTIYVVLLAQEPPVAFPLYCTTP